jgi:ectoine hydroxylase-related dioxygenase (phytanoyl-CoA dioxygenase family)
MQFSDTIAQHKFQQNGYVVIDFLDAIEIEALKQIYMEHPSNKVADFQVSNYEKDTAKNKIIDSKIKNIIQNKIALHFKDYKLLSAFFYVKFTGTASSFYVHKDWNCVDESKETSIHIWIPLKDTTTQNGNLFFCPFDYKKQLTFRGSPGFEFPEPSFFTKKINSIYKKNIFTKSGQAVCFDHRLTHGSNSNLTDEVRVAAGISLIPKNVQMIHYHKNKKGQIETHEVKEDFYIDFDLENNPNIIEFNKD